MGGGANWPPNGSPDMDTVEPEFGLERDITAYLSEIRFADRVMTELAEVPRKTRKTLIWAGFCLANVFLLVIFGTNSSFISEFFALQEDLAQFFFLFLGITLLGGLIGLVAVSDTSWLRGYLPRPAPRDE
jgi:hypothetical protein